MHFVGFEIENFKGIGKTALDFSKIPHSNIFTLVGLNESGKTTILEAINSFSPDAEGVSALYPDVFKAVHPQDLIPKAQKGNFTGSISVRAFVSVTEDDKKRIAKFCGEKLNSAIDTSKIANTLKITRRHDFVNSAHKETKAWWDIDIYLKKGRQAKFKKHGAESTDWHSIISYLGSNFPKICYPDVLI